MATPIARNVLKLIDIGANLTDPMFRGIYHGTMRHRDDFDDMLQRCWDGCLDKIIVTGGSYEDCKEALELASKHDRLYCTVGCHPTRCKEFESASSPDEYLSNLLTLAQSSNKVVAIGECGLDYDRLKFCPKETQLKYFERQLDLAEQTRLPMFLHCRNASSDLIDIVSRHRHRISGAVVHSFTGSADDVLSFVDLGFYIGINGCSLKTAENLEVVKGIPSDRLMLETDAPWCEIRPTHDSFKHVLTTFPSRKKEKFEDKLRVKSRNEPSCIIQVLEVLSAVRSEDQAQLAETVYRNTCNLFHFS